MRVLFQIIFIFFLHSQLFAQKEQEFIISGYVKDSANGEALIGATVSVKGTNRGTMTNGYGFYSLRVEAGKQTIEVKYLGYVARSQELVIKENAKVIFELSNEDVQVNEVVISDKKGDENVKNNEMSTARIDVETIKTMPAFLGEVDVIKSIQLMPGVIFAGDGISGFYVRGGGADQNLVLLDEAIVYNASHLLGFFSVFNSDAIKDVTLYKGGMPAQYGGRASAVLDIRMNDGNSKKFAVKGGIGTIASRLTVQGPIKKEKGSFIISGRRSYADIYLKFANDPALRKNKLYFYDLNLKANYELGQKDKIFISGYTGKDVFNFSEEFGFDWGNQTGTVRWSHIFNDKLFCNNTFIFSDFKYRFNIKQDSENVRYTSGVQDFSLKTDLDFYSSPKLTFKIGQQATWHSFITGKLEPTGQSNITPYILPKKHAWEQGLYAQVDQKIGLKLQIKYGIRLSYFAEMGPTKLFTFDDHLDNIANDTIEVKSMKVVKAYPGIEPRINVAYNLDDVSSIKFSYARAYQYLNLVTNSSSSLPTDIWVPASKGVKPQIGDQIAAGYFRNFANNNWETSAEVYYKWLQNQIEFRPEANLFLNPNLEGQLAFGKGWSYGLELFIKKRSGKFTGWVGYTLSFTKRQVDIINNNEPYFSKNDRRHDMNVVLSYQPTARWTFAGTWVLASGNSVSFPTGKYELDGQSILLYDKLFQDRMPAYHRMDLSVTLHGKKTKKFRSDFNLSVYNAYNRHNAWAITFEEDPDNKNQLKTKKIYLFSVVPALTWNFSF